MEAYNWKRQYFLESCGVDNWHFSQSDDNAHLFFIIFNNDFTESHFQWAHNQI